tara:strand:- start:282 stop:446 length:165 start_codon:yes stop_codon:yes gene_type:complete
MVELGGIEPPASSLEAVIPAKVFFNGRPKEKPRFTGLLSYRKLPRLWRLTHWAL